MQGKRLRGAYETVKGLEDFGCFSVISALKDCPKAKFDETLEVVLSLNLRVGKVEHNVRGFVSLPHGTGKTVRVLAFVQDDQVAEATDAGASLVGGEALVDAIAKGSQGLDFDRCVAAPAMMPFLGKIGKILGPRGLMPNPKTGTVSAKIGEAVRSLMGGQVSFASDKAGCVRVGLGKLSFSADQLVENFRAFFDAIHGFKPQGLKSVFIKGAWMSSTMGPGVPLSLEGLAKFSEFSRSEKEG